MCIPDAADRLWLSSETQINSNRAISPSLGISARGRNCLRSLAWLGAHAVPGNGLATLSGFYGARSAGMQRRGLGETGCEPKEKILLCHAEAGDTRAEVLLHEPGSCKRGFAMCEGQKMPPLRHPTARAPPRCRHWGCALPSPPAAPQPQAQSSSPHGPLAPSVPPSCGLWASSGAGQEGDGAGKAVAGNRSQQRPHSCRGVLAVLGGWRGWEGLRGGRGQLHYPLNPPSISPCRSSQGFMHMKLSRTQENKYVLGQHSPPFDSVPEIIHHYASRKLPIKGAEHMSLLYPVAIRTL